MCVKEFEEEMFVFFLLLLFWAHACQEIFNPASLVVARRETMFLFSCPPHGSLHFTHIILEVALDALHFHHGGPEVLCMRF
jgi:hypothetical protein